MAGFAATPVLAPPPAIAASSASDEFSEVLGALLQILLASSSAADAAASCKVLSKALANILSHPAELKYRSLPTGNKTVQRRIVSTEGAMDVLSALGFELTTEALVLTGDLDTDRIETAVALLQCARPRSTSDSDRVCGIDRQCSIYFSTC